MRFRDVLNLAGTATAIINPSVGGAILAINKITGDVEHELPDADAVVRIPLDADLAERSVRGDAIDDGAGPASRAAIEELTSHCLGTAPQAAVSNP